MEKDIYLEKGDSIASNDTPHHPTHRPLDFALIHPLK